VIHFPEIGSAIHLNYSPIYNNEVNVTALYDYETFKNANYDYKNLPKNSTNKYYVASTPDSLMPLAYRNHRGTDCQAEHRAPLYAISDCVVVDVVLDAYNVLTLCDNLNYYEYWHCDTIVVSVGQTLKKGQLVATQGSTGATNSHLHFVVRNKNKDVIDGLNIIANITNVTPTFDKNSVWFLDIW